MKKIFTTLLTVFIIASLAGCTSDNASAGKKPEEAVTENHETVAPTELGPATTPEDTHTYARVYTPDGKVLVEGKASSWKSYLNGRTHVVIDGMTYNVDSAQVFIYTDE